ncbi:MAG TPA: phosphate ABC transporter ATP-binding protein [Vicinamibacterales bacterium]|nr:phosphate ABC transporter ATP-binding protein [Vicinamibacterales bacterium]HOQ60983.1 phosphate ABC transporter ATP-binding protein [Vicinamibacterales bacterium]HPK72822.1 phosphate ABC transporter ATP-binding protein [Vicinamibacterales bacterium]
MKAGATPAYALQGIRHRYGDRTVLEIDRLEIAAGRTLGVVGPSGAGKSTLLRLLQGLERPAEGEIRVDGELFPYPAPLALARRITTVFQRPAMLDRSVRDNVTFGLRLRGKAEEPVVDALLERLGLAPLARADARKLSGGETQRVALARALAVEPDVLLLDEPAANLDPAHVALVEALIRDVQARGTTIVLVTHNTHEARRLAHDTLLLLDGKMVEAAPTAAFFESPTNARARAFLAGELVY